MILNENFIRICIGIYYFLFQFVLKRKIKSNMNLKSVSTAL